MTEDHRADARGSSADEPWVETREGGLFFVNALLIFPHVMVLFPLITRTVVRAGGGFADASPIVDTFPEIAEYLLPRAGWLLVVPIALASYGLRITRAAWARLALAVFLATHLAFLGWTVGVWFGMWPPVLPGGP